VEPEFVRLWRRYQAALRQRNSLLKSDAPEGQLEPWELELARAGEAISRQRQTYLARLSERFAQVAADIVPGLEHPRLQFLPGWDMEADIGLAGQLAARRFRDRQRQTTTLGPHRADWRPAFGPDDSPATLSRGQQKLVALSAVLGQAEVYRDQRGDWPVLLFDDLASELDRRHQQGLLDRLAASGAQCLISATDASEAMQSRMAQASVFHVERGQVRPAQGGTPQLGILVSSATTP
jgi:DNA replication and repair protein RecF